MFIFLFGLALIVVGLIFGVVFGIIGATVATVVSILGFLLGIILSVMKFITFKMVPLVIGLCVILTLIFFIII